MGTRFENKPSHCTKSIIVGGHSNTDRPPPKTIFGGGWSTWLESANLVETLVGQDS